MEVNNPHFALSPEELSLVTQVKTEKNIEVHKPEDNKPDTFILIIDGKKHTVKSHASLHNDETMNAAANKLIHLLHQNNLMTENGIQIRHIADGREPQATFFISRNFEPTTEAAETEEATPTPTEPNLHFQLKLSEGNQPKIVLDPDPLAKDLGARPLVMKPNHPLYKPMIDIANAATDTEGEVQVGMVQYRDLLNTIEIYDVNLALKRTEDSLGSFYVVGSDTTKRLEDLKDDILATWKQIFNVKE